MQSGSNAMLKAMHRPYTAQKFEELVTKIRSARPGIAVTTDIIVGFPGETEEFYQETYDLCDRLKFENAFIFRYSKRRGTPAAEMEDALQLPERVKEQRNQHLLMLINKHAQATYEPLVGTDVEVLCEGPSKTNASRLSGRTRTNKIVVFEGPAGRLAGNIFNVHVNEFAGFTLYGDPVLSAE
jgi:tRNA-2-methylthio-N6-dimethylallyladenosine synthase